MIQNLSGSGRRVLAIPAVHPSENASPYTLLTSLIDLSHGICKFRSKHFSTNARNARGTIRHVSNLLIFFEEARVSLGSGISDSAILSLSELHLALQKINYLLEDCTREGARLWMLMKSDRVAAQFRVLSLSISTGLDVLPIESLHVSSEARELVQLVMRQTRRSEFQVGRDDKTAVTDVELILSQFVNGVIPDNGDIKRVLDNIGVTKWSECDKEVRFLDTEIGMLNDTGEADDRVTATELEQLSGLLGFACYSKCVIFRFVDNPITKSHYHTVELRCLNSEDFRCPISLELMKDPVTIETGHTYDRSSILKWFRSGNATCPKTGNKLNSTGLVPNLVVKRLIQEYCLQNGISFPEMKSSKCTNRKNGSVLSSAAEGAMKLTAKFLVSVLANGSNCEEEKSKAVYEIRILTKSSALSRSCLVEADVVPHLLTSLFQENAIAALLNISKHPEGKSVIAEHGGLEFIVDVLRRGVKVESRQDAAAALFYLASVDEYRKRIGEIPDAIQGLVELVKERVERRMKNALVAIYCLLLHPGNHRKVLASGVVPLLTGVISTSGGDNEEILTDALAVLASLADRQEGTKCILKCNALPQIVEVLESFALRGGKEQCVSLLLALCVNGGDEVVRVLVKSASLIGSLYSVLGEGTSRGSKKASALIRILQEFYERSSSSSSGSKALPPHHHVPRDWFVHVW